MTILTCADINLEQLQHLLGKFKLNIQLVAADQEIPGSWFGDSEAGIIKNNLHIRMDTPVHSALHESCHYICMDSTRRKHLHTDAGGDYDEENGVCYLQILLADYIEGFGRERMFSDMDEWGYTFRLGSSKAWFNEDAEDAKQWLLAHAIINENEQPLYNLRK
ncbi:MAG: hypothetical protein OQL06_10355 [Gammaproteobacteria bacterium]|nr:hypothetical protein [Gammaproteobacteria bacterium]